VEHPHHAKWLRGNGDESVLNLGERRGGQKLQITFSVDFICISVEWIQSVMVLEALHVSFQNLVFTY
jgi:hypothetical protein